MSYKAQIWASSIKTGNPTSKSVLMAIAFFADADGMTYMPQAEIVGYTEFSDRSIRNALARLVTQGLLIRVPRFHRDGSRTTDRLELSMLSKLDPNQTILSQSGGEVFSASGAPYIEVTRSPNRIYGVSPAKWQSLRRQVFARDGLICAYCAGPAHPPHCDHVVAFSRGGLTALDNLTTACADCNVGKKNRSAEQWIAVLRARAEALSAASTIGASDV